VRPLFLPSVVNFGAEDFLVISDSSDIQAFELAGNNFSINGDSTTVKFFSLVVQRRHFTPITHSITSQTILSTEVSHHVFSVFTKIV